MMDQTREQEVWKRVMEVSAQAPACCKAPKHETVTAQQVMELLLAERDDSCTYRALADRVRTAARQKLVWLARQESEHYKKLETVYYLMTGKKPCPDRPKRPCIACVSEELRSRYHEEVKGAQTYHRLAEKAGSFDAVFHALGHEEEQHAQIILQVLQTCL